MRRYAFTPAPYFSLQLAPLEHLSGREVTKLHRVAGLQVVMLMHGSSSRSDDALLPHDHVLVRQAINYAPHRTA